MNTYSETRKEPVLQYVIFCESIVKRRNENKFDYINEFSTVLSPSILPQFFIALKWICGIGSHNFSVRILNHKVKTIHSFEDVEITLNKEVDSARCHLSITNVHFTNPGLYRVKVLLNGEDYISIPI